MKRSAVVVVVVVYDLPNCAAKSFPPLSWEMPLPKLWAECCHCVDFLEWIDLDGKLDGRVHGRGVVLAPLQFRPVLDTLLW